MTILMSNAAVAHNAMTTTFATNHGPNKATVFTATAASPATLTAGAGTGAGVPSKYYVDVPITTFLYDPAKGPLLLDFASDGTKWVGGTTYSNAVTSGGHDVARMYNLTSHTALTGSLQASVGLVCELTFTIVPGIYPAFSADKTSGVPPLKVAFKDETVDTKGKVFAWTWDFGDGSPKSTAQNPTHTYGKAGSYDVSLTAIGPTGPATPLVKKGYILVADPVRSVPDIFQYQFNDPRSAGPVGYPAAAFTKVANTASGASAPAFGTASNAKWQGGPNRPKFDPNEKGLGMVADPGTVDTNYVTTGWPLSVKGSMTIMWWQKMKVGAITNAFGYMWGGAGSNWRCFNRGAAGNSILYRGTTAVGDLNAGINLHHNNWVHLALVVDDKAGTAAWYVDGVKGDSRIFTPGTHTASNTGFMVGKHTATSTAGVYYALDDFRFYSRAVTVGEILGAMEAENASTNNYGVGCPGASGQATISAMGDPHMGNMTFGFKLAGAEASRPMVLTIGYGAVGGGVLPFDVSAQLGSGCYLETGLELLVIGTTSSTGTNTTPLPVPVAPGLEGFHVYAQYHFQGATSGGNTQGLDVNVQQ